MLLCYPLNDGQTKPRALLPGRNVGLDQPVAVLFRQSAAIVDHVNDEPVLDRAQPDDDAPLSFAAAIRILIGINGFAGVFHEVRDGLGKKPPVTQCDQRLFQRINFEFNFRPAHLEQDDGFADDLANVLLLENRRRHARE